MEGRVSQTDQLDQRFAPTDGALVASPPRPTHRLWPAAVIALALGSTVIWIYFLCWLLIRMITSLVL